MKLGTVKNGTRDGQLAVISKSGESYTTVTDIAPTLQFALDHWDQKAPQLEAIYRDLNEGKISGQEVELAKFMAPLPRAYEWIDGSAYINHIVLVRKARGAKPPETLETDPLVYQGGSGVLLGPTDDIKLANPEWGCDFESEVCVVLGDTPQGVKPEVASKYVKLIGIVNDVSLRNLIPGELAKNFGFFNSKPASAFAPFFVTPDELGDAWREGRVHLPLITHYKGEKYGDPDAGPEMHFSFFDLVSHITKTRSYTAGTILGSGTVSNEDRARGSSCLAEKRMIEKIDDGEIRTPFMVAGDTIRIEMLDKNGASIFGAIDQKVVEGSN
ncbi:fumarylacetoacetate hydrolase family protein [Pseudobacteriovorax antillogorgiicola]|uniref:Fumarylacetoacetate (FAA) hydrolase n=1 Tax=Pseudobacteriovorax antillogorgiicola TaxID=1513793 RepID=A0A1Y6B3Q7_9BACT|nr:fumarylacetoacetate hydrolase family protein [Pseudobacteriovorax antillogorgiicola]TCS59252.1 fumarylacetoacetate (FAA) hydrolase [Pseudobacteriovorax antillogorgiicola]SME90024.1 fumarylacetoacetate (FAA) hydrolase [Pseudobacteriovorax antillogorgiicola]